jgi:DNA-binding MarR family transcriptional regulator
MTANMNKKDFHELASLFFTTRQIIRSKLPQDGSSDPSGWHRLEALRFIGEQKNPTMQDVANYVCVKAPSATSLIAHLASRGLVVRKKGKGDKRIVYISLTKKGEAVLRAYKKNSSSTMQTVFMKLGPEKIRQLASILRDLQNIHDARE